MFWCPVMLIKSGLGICKMSPSSHFKTERQVQKVTAIYEMHPSWLTTHITFSWLRWHGHICCTPTLIYFFDTCRRGRVRMHYNWFSLPNIVLVSVTSEPKMLQRLQKFSYATFYCWVPVIAWIDKKGSQLLDIVWFSFSSWTGCPEETVLEQSR